MNTPLEINIQSEIGKLNSVMLHVPGNEVENMTPENAERALYSDILNLKVAAEEYSQFDKLLNKLTKVHYMDDLLTQTLSNDTARKSLINSVCKLENAMSLEDSLLALDDASLAKALIQGKVLEKNSLTDFLSKERYALQPLHNFFFMRDASVSLWNNVLISNMANKVRQREALIMNAIFSTQSDANVVNALQAGNLNIEGGDVLIARHNLILIGVGKRTTSQGVDFLIQSLVSSGKTDFTVIVQQLPAAPESFIHLDMVFTLLDEDACMVYEPLILKHNSYQTIAINVEHGKVSNIEAQKNLLSALKAEGMDLKPIICGGKSDSWVQEREQWHSGTNFFSVAPGKVIGYARNSYTVEELNRNGFEVLTAGEIVSGEKNIENYKRCVLTLDGSELARGGGGARCMTMPLNRTL